MKILQAILFTLIMFIGVYLIYHRLNSRISEKAAFDEVKHQSASSSQILKIPLANQPDNNLASPALRAFTNKSLPLSQRFPDSLDAAIPKLTDENDILSVESLVTDIDEEDILRNEAVDILFRSNDIRLPSLLISCATRTESSRFGEFAVQHLGTILMSHDPKFDLITVRQALVDALTSKFDAQRREALYALSENADPAANTIIHSGLTDPTWNQCADLIIRCMHERNMRDELRSIRPYAYSPIIPTRIAAIVCLSDWKDQASIPAFEAAAASDDIIVKKAGEIALKKM